jgi:hypothetical protein
LILLALLRSKQPRKENNLLEFLTKIYIWTGEFEVRAISFKALAATIILSGRAFSDFDFALYLPI